MVADLRKLNSDGYTANSLLTVLVGILSCHSKLGVEQIVAKLICFGTDGVSSFL